MRTMGSSGGGCRGWAEGPTPTTVSRPSPATSGARAPMPMCELLGGCFPCAFVTLASKAPHDCNKSLTHSLTQSTPPFYLHFPHSYVYLCGVKDGQEIWGPKHVLDTSKNNFERSMMDTFLLTKHRNLGDLKCVKIGHDNSGLGPGEGAREGKGIECMGREARSEPQCCRRAAM
jgi:hypothetical protein